MSIAYKACECMTSEALFPSLCSGFDRDALGVSVQTRSPEVVALLILYKSGTLKGRYCGAAVVGSSRSKQLEFGTHSTATLALPRFPSRSRWISFDGVTGRRLVDVVVLWYATLVELSICQDMDSCSKGVFRYPNPLKMMMWVLIDDGPVFHGFEQVSRFASFFSSFCLYQHRLSSTQSKPWLLRD